MGEAREARERQVALKRADLKNELLAKTFDLLSRMDEPVTTTVGQQAKQVTMPNHGRRTSATTR
jgi:hypothetical protein